MERVNRARSGLWGEGFGNDPFLPGRHVRRYITALS